MKFNEKLILIMDCLDISNMELAKACKFDPTVISRYRCGNRIPTQNSNTLNNLVSGICTIALEKGKEKNIYKVCSVKENDLFSSIMSWFCEDESGIRLSKNENGLIGENLTSLMKLFNVTNVELAKYLNKDYSLISKYRNNVTILLKTDKTAENICDYFICNSIKSNSLSSLTSLLDISEDSDANSVKNSLIEYLFYNKKVSSPVHNFLENLSEFKLNSEMALPPLNNLVSNEILNSKNQLYIGTTEFRNSVQKFLGNVAINTMPTVLSLYSDQSLKWMTGDKLFFSTWKALMTTVLMRKNKIRIIHNINRNLIEMFDAIEGWLPLYMTGLIEPYYCKKTLNNRFNHTLFLAKDLAVISSYSIRGNENNAIYNYSEDKTVIKQYEKQYNTLLENCSPLVKIYVGNKITKKIENIKEYTRIKNNKLKNIEVFSKKGLSTLVLKTNTPSIMFEFEHPSMIDAFDNYISSIVT